LDLRERVAAAAAHTPLAQVAEQFSVSRSLAEKLRARQRATGSVAALPCSRGPAPRLGEAAHQHLIAQLQGPPDATLQELRTGLLEANYPAVSRGKICQLLQQLGWDRQKNASRHRAREGAARGVRGTDGGRRRDSSAFSKRP
jgi:transposase